MSQRTIIVKKVYPLAGSKYNTASIVTEVNGMEFKISVKPEDGGAMVHKGMEGNSLTLDVNPWVSPKTGKTIYFGKLAGAAPAPAVDPFAQQARHQPVQSTNGDGGDRNSSIERQCCLKAAVELCKDAGGAADYVVTIAETFYKWVSGEKQAVSEPDYDGQDETPVDDSDVPF